jgi:Holliday junction resolvase RusA-like endonuclease
MVPIAPMGKPRQTQSDKWKKRPVVIRWREYADNLRMIAKAMKFTLPTEGAEFTFYIPMPDSWSDREKREMDGMPHKQKPDLDNLVKGVMDALLPDKDCEVWHIGCASKYWAKEGMVKVEIPFKEVRAA